MNVCANFFKTLGFQVQIYSWARWRSLWRYDRLRLKMVRDCGNTRSHEM